MEQPQQTPISASRPPETPPETGSQPQQPPSASASSSSAPSIPSSAAPPPSPSFTSNPNPTQFPRPMNSPSPQQQQQLPQSLAHPPQTAYSRPWQQHSTFSHFPTTSSPLLSSPSVSASSSSSLAVSTPQRGGMAIGLPASSIPSPPRPSPSQPSAFPGSFGQQFGGLGRGTVGMSEASSNSNVPQVRSMQGTQGIGMMGTLGSGSQMRPSGLSSSQHQQRPAQSSNFQGHNLMRASPVGSPGVQSTSTSQSMQSLNQPWLSSSTQGKPPLPSPSYRPQVNPPSMQQRSHIPQQQQQSQPQQHPSTPTTSSQPQQQQSLQQHQPQEQLQTLRSTQQPLSHPHQLPRVLGSVNQKPASPATAAQPTVAQPGTQGKTVSAENEESGDCILGKRSIRELIQQIDPSEKLEPEVEDVLADIAEDFVESITTFGCSLAKHRKSDTLEAKDILLHVERNWNIRPPGYYGDEIKMFRKPLTTDIHRERLAAVKKSMMATEAANARNPIGQGTVNAKGGQAKTPANPLASPTFNH